MHVAATALHELFRTLVSVGFSEQQALSLVSSLIEKTANANP
jgi:Holliday junction resolvasome RuvABC DNA-binding subunit